jgi:hypothetical protein
MLPASAAHGLVCQLQSRFASSNQRCESMQEAPVSDAIAPYLVAVSAMLFAAISALTLIHTVSRLDPPDAGGSREEARKPIEVGEKVLV